MSNLKDAEDYYRELPYLGPFLSSAQGYDVFVNTIKQVQRDTIALTAKMCAKNAKTITVWDGNTGSEYCDTVVDKDSIIKTGEELIKEIE